MVQDRDGLVNTIVHGVLCHMSQWYIIWVSNSGPSQQCSSIVFKIIGDHVVIFAHTRDQRRLTF